MDEELIFKGIGYIGIILVTLAGLPQILKTYNLKDSSGLSCTFILLIEIGVLFLFIYSLYLKDIVYMFANGSSLLMNTILLGIWIKWRKK